jgi:anti-sigma-K factor RskA
MIDEHRQDLAAEYALDALDPESTRAFEALLAEDAELRALADHLREAAAALAHDVPSQLPPPELRERVLARIRAEAQSAAADESAVSQVTPEPKTTPAVTPQASGGFGTILPWALAAGFAITTGALWMERNQWQQETVGLKQVIKDQNERDELAKVKIAMLTAQVDAYAKASAVIVWDPSHQRGVVKLANVPRPEAGKDYQLWLIDPKKPDPVSGGLIAVSEEGTAKVMFTPDQQVGKADKFAISVEPTGGMPKPTGMIVLAGN